MQSGVCLPWNPLRQPVPLACLPLLPYAKVVPLHGGPVLRPWCVGSSCFLSSQLKASPSGKSSYSSRPEQSHLSSGSSYHPFLVSFLHKTHQSPTSSGSHICLQVYGFTLLKTLFSVVLQRVLYEKSAWHLGGSQEMSAEKMDGGHILHCVCDLEVKQLPWATNPNSWARSKCSPQDSCGGHLHSFQCFPPVLERELFP